MSDVQRKLARIQGRFTKYEVILTHKNYTSILLRYTGRKSRRGLIDAFDQCLSEVARLTGCKTAECVGDKIVTDNHWIVRFSGRTQRQAIINGERPFIADVESLDYDPNFVDDHVVCVHIN